MLRDNTRKDYDTLSDYGNLLRQVRIKEKELLHAELPLSSSKRAQHNPVSYSSPHSSVFNRKLRDLEPRLESRFSTSLSTVHKRLADMDSRFDQIMKKLDSPTQSQHLAYQSKNNKDDRGRWNGRRRG